MTNDDDVVHLDQVTVPTRSVAGSGFSIPMTREMMLDWWGDPDDPYTQRWHDRPDKSVWDQLVRRRPPWQSPDRPALPDIDPFPTITRIRQEVKVRAVAPRSWVARRLEEVAWKIAPWQRDEWM